MVITQPTQQSVFMEPSNGKTIVHTYQAVLSQEPSSKVLVDVGPSLQPSSCSGCLGVLAEPRLLTFTKANWNTPQTVTISLEADTGASGGELQFIISHTTRSLDLSYNSLVLPQLPVRTFDDDSESIYLVETNGETLVAEGTGQSWNTDTYDVYLSHCPVDGSEVTVTAVPQQNEHGRDQVKVEPATATFSNKGGACKATFTVRAVQDDISEGIHFAFVTHEVTATGSRFQGLKLPIVSVTIYDDEVSDIVMIDKKGLGYYDYGESASYSLALTADPKKKIGVALKASEFSDRKMIPSSSAISFDSSNWQTPQKYLF